MLPITKDKEKWIRICPKCGKTIYYQSYAAWHNALKKNSLCKSCSYKKSAYHCAKLNKLLQDTPEAFYWIGFLLSDGGFVDNRLSLTLNLKDKNSVLDFAKFIEYETNPYIYKNSIRIACKDIDIVPLICKKFDIQKRKTYNPPKTLKQFDKNLLIALLAGFIDGDGRIAHPTKRKDFFLTIKVHSTWLSILKEFNNLITDKNFCKINNAGYAVLTITDTNLLQNLKRKILNLNIPIMHRKWNIIDLNFVSKYTKAKILRDKVLNLYYKGYKNVEISKLCNTCPANVTKIIKIYG